MWITALQESAHALQQQVNMLGTALRTPAEPETATAFADLFGLDRLWPSYRAAASQTTDDRHYSAIRALSPADREALAQTNDAEVEFLQLIGAAPAAFLLVLRNRTVLYATQKLMIMTGLHIENIIGRNMDVLFVRCVLRCVEFPDSANDVLIHVIFSRCRPRLCPAKSFERLKTRL